MHEFYTDPLRILSDPFSAFRYIQYFQIHSTLSDPFNTFRYIPYFYNPCFYNQCFIISAFSPFSTFRAQKKPETPNLHFDS